LGYVPWTKKAVQTMMLLWDEGGYGGGDHHGFGAAQIDPKVIVCVEEEDDYG